MMNLSDRTKIALLLAVVTLFLFGFVLHRESAVVQEFEAAWLSEQWMLLICFAVWCGTFLILNFKLKDLPLFGLLTIAIIEYFIAQAANRPAMDAITLLFGVTQGKGMGLVLQNGSNLDIHNLKFAIRNFLTGIVLLLAFASCWHLDTSENFYPAGVRWTGLWNNPNDYGMLMSSGLLLAVGLLAGIQKEELRMKKLLPIILLISVGMMTAGLFFSYSRGAWLGTAIGLLYLAKAYKKLKWKYTLTGIGLLALGILVFWGRTPNSSSWYVKRMDLGRASAQHRVAAWKAGFEIMRDHPFGVGWNKAVETYGKNYSPPEGGASAITTNDYLMLGTQLGIPALICFVVYVALCLRSKPKIETEEGRILAACRAGAIVFLVTFWFDGGLFKLPTAALFWVLLELSASSFSRQKSPKCS